MSSSGEAGPTTASIACGFLGCDARPLNPLLAALPWMVRLRTRAERDGSWPGHLIDAAVAEATEGRVGGGSIVARLSELMFIELVRRHVEAMPAEATGWFAGLRDPHVGRALNLLHGRASEPWTLEQLAQEVGLSRSSLAERFARLIGQPPMQCLAQWRVQLAAGMLASGGRQVARSLWRSATSPRPRSAAPSTRWPGCRPPLGAGRAGARAADAGGGGAPRGAPASLIPARLP